jgi:hypothetical protein
MTLLDEEIIRANAQREVAMKCLQQIAIDLAIYTELRAQHAGVLSVVRQVPSEVWVLILEYIVVPSVDTNIHEGIWACARVNHQWQAWRLQALACGVGSRSM